MSDLRFVVAVWVICIPIAWTLWGVSFICRNEHEIEMEDWKREFFWLVLLWPAAIGMLLLFGMVAPVLLYLDCRHKQKSREAQP